MAEIDLRGQNVSLCYILLFKTTIARNMIKVFGFSEEFTPKQQTLQYFTNRIQHEEKNSVVVDCD